MKPIIRFLLILLLCGALLLPAQAAPADLTLSNGEAAAGEVVYLTVALNKKTLGDTMGVEYSYDTKHLEAVPELCAWSKGGSVKDFGLKGRGVWATATAIQLEGNICVLAFRIKKDADFSETAVSCELVVKNGSEQTGKYQAEATVKIACSHSFSAWQTDGGSLHSRSCESCGLSQTQPHSWDAGVVQVDPGSSDQKIRLYTCADCGATRQEEVPDTTPESTSPTNPTTPKSTEPEPTEPDRPQPTEPDRPQPTEPDRPQPTEPDRPQPTEPDRVEPTQPTEPPVTQPQNPGQSQDPTQPQQDHTGHDHGDMVITTVPAQQPSQDIQHSPDDGHDHSEAIYDADGNVLAILDPDDPDETLEVHTPDDGHDHSGDQVLITETKPKTGTTLVLAALALACIGAAVYFVKKKKH